MDNSKLQLELKSKPSNPETHTLDSSSYLNILGKTVLIHPEKSLEPTCMKDIPTRNDIETQENYNLDTVGYRSKYIEVNQNSESTNPIWLE